MWIDTDSDGQYDIGTENPLAGVTVALLDGAGNPATDLFGFPQTTTTDVNGRYSFDSLAPGDYRVEFTLPIGLRLDHRQHRRRRARQRSGRRHARRARPRAPAWSPSPRRPLPTPTLGGSRSPTRRSMPASCPSSRWATSSGSTRTATVSTTSVWSCRSRASRSRSRPVPAARSPMPSERRSGPPRPMPTVATRSRGSYPAPTGSSSRCPPATCGPLRTSAPTAPTGSTATPCPPPRTHRRRGRRRSPSPRPR